MRKNIHPIEELFVLLEQFESYPDGVIQIPGRIPGTAFFPGGLGLWNTQPNAPPPPVPVGGSLIVGHNFDSEAGFHRSFHHAGENLKGATWRNLLAFLKQVGIAPEQCFFTNAYVGLRAGNHAMGAFAGARDPEFVCWCRNFFLEQLRFIQPRLILTLGLHVPGFLAPLSPELKSAWSDVRRFGRLDERGVALVYPSTFSGVLLPAAVVALTHPAYRRLNVKSRRYQNLQGDAAEQALVREALARVGNGETKERLGSISFSLSEQYPD
jgi:uracil-DNA glycosylase